MINIIVDMTDAEEFKRANEEKKDKCKYCKYFPDGYSGYYECKKDGHRIDRGSTCRWESKGVWEEKNGGR